MLPLPDILNITEMLGAYVLQQMAL